MRFGYHNHMGRSQIQLQAVTKDSSTHMQATYSRNVEAIAGENTYEARCMRSVSDTESLLRVKVVRLKCVCPAAVAIEESSIATAAGYGTRQDTWYIDIGNRLCTFAFLTLVRYVENLLSQWGVGASKSL